MSRTRGFKDVYIAKVIKNDSREYTTEAPTKLFGAVSGKINVKRSTEKTYADDEVDEVMDSFDSVEIELEGNALTMEKLALLYGSTLINGILDDATTDEANEVAVGFRVKTKGGKYNFHWYFCGKFNEEDSDEFETQADKVATKTKTIKGTFYGRKLDSKFRRRVHEEELLEEDSDAKTALEIWFSKVPGQTGITE